MGKTNTMRAARTDVGLNKVALIGNHTPRRCGIATFTADLAGALAGQAPQTAFWTVVMNDVAGGYDYPQQVRFELDEARLTDYRLAAEFLNMNQVDVACLQHEYGIFGGADGRYILKLIGELRMPVVTTLHTVLKDPTAGQLDTLRKLAGLSDRLVVLSRTAGDFLRDIYQVPEDKIAFIHHGIPDVAFADPNYYKDQFGVEGRRVILTFGLLSPNKGIEHMVRALPGIVKRYPDTVYIVLGVTHPHVLRHEGESYRLSLQQLAKSLGVADNLIFQNRFVDDQELREFLGAGDIYVTPYVNEAQISSGTLAYAMGSGKAIVSTPYWYAAEMLAQERGRLVPFNDSEAIAAQVLDLFDNPVEANAMRKRAYLFARDAVWPQVAQEYLRVFEEAREERTRLSGYTFSSRTLQADFADVPELNLDYLRRLTDHTGILQHATFNVPDLRHGYCTDDNARALIVAALAEKVLPEDTTIARMRGTYLAFLQYALVGETGRFRNFLPYDRHWVEEMGSDDSQGRALWGLGVAIRESTDPGQLGLATSLFNQAMPTAEQLGHLRSRAMALLGLEAYLERYSGDSEAKRLRDHLAERLLHAFSSHATADWPWPEDIVTYDNGKIPHALLLAGRSMERADMVEMGLRALDWLVDLQTESGYFVPVGSNGWYVRGGARARFDQQPLEAHSMIDACITANAVSGDEKWVEAAMLAFQWFLGQNDIKEFVCDLRGGGCYDGLQPDGVNLNQGAESTLAWLLSLMQMHLLRADRSLKNLARREAVAGFAPEPMTGAATGAAPVNA
ncbi:MAG: glycosyltransferase family 4 protein [Thermoleophilia bacterium]